MIIVFFLFFGFFLYKFYLKKISFIYLFFPVFIILGYFTTYINTKSDGFIEALEYGKRDCCITGEVSNVSSTQYGYRLFIEDAVVYSDTEYSRGDTVQVQGSAELFEEPDNPGEFNTKKYYESLKIKYRIYAEEITLLKKNDNPIYFLADRVADRINSTFYKIADEKSASVFAAMLLGNKNELDDDISDLFSACGIGHILAISGLHISIIGMGLYKLIRRAGAGYIAAMVVSGSLIIFYGIVTGNGISTNRALIMFLTAVYANVAERTYDLLSGAALAAFLMLADSPMLIYNSGFLLSFSAIGGIGIINPVLISVFEKPGKILKSFISGISIQLASLPIIMYSYYEIPIYSSLLNMIVIPLMTFVMISALAGGIIGSFVEIIGKLCIGIGVYILKGYEFLCNLYLKLPNAVWVCGKPDDRQIIIYYIILGIALYFIYNSGKIRYCGGIILSIMIIILRFNKEFEAVFLDVGQGDGIFIRSGDCTVLIDGGSSDENSLYEYTLEPFLLSKGVSELDYGIVTHPDTDHISGLKELLFDGKIKVHTLIMPSVKEEDEAYTELRRLAQSAGTKVVTIYRGMSFSLEGTEFTCLHPTYESDLKDRNDYSIVLKVEYEDFSMLLTGDISSEQEMDILELIEEPVDVLKAAHHGSKYSNSLSFLNSANPQTIVISCGKDNDYGHPHREAVERMEEIGASVKCTYEQGAIIFSKGDIRVFL